MRYCLWCRKLVGNHQDFCCREHCELYEAEGRRQRKEKAYEKMKKCLEIGRIMRGYQRTFFDKANKFDMRSAMAYEKKFDAEVDRILGKPNTEKVQDTLFPLE